MPTQNPTSVSPIGLHRVLEPAGSLPQSATRLDPDSPLRADEVAVDVERLNLDAASFRQIREACGDDPDAIRAHVLGIITSRGKMHNPVTGSGGMLFGTVAEVGPDSTLGVQPGDKVATLVSLTLTPLRVGDELTAWDAHSEQVPTKGRAILFGRSIVAKVPDDLPETMSLAVLDVCGAPALTRRTIERAGATSVTVIGGGGKSGSLSLAAAKQTGARTIAVVPTQAEADLLAGIGAGLADTIVVTDARDPVGVATAVADAGGPTDLTVVCVDVPGCEHGAILCTAEGGTVIFFSMATSFSAAALGAEGLAADVTMLVGNGYTPGHADLAIELVRSFDGVRALFEHRLRAEGAL